MYADSQIVINMEKVLHWYNGSFVGCRSIFWKYDTEDTDQQRKVPFSYQVRRRTDI